MSTGSPMNTADMFLVDRLLGYPVFMIILMTRGYSKKRKNTWTIKSFLNSV
jgi:hypothetical protein